MTKEKVGGHVENGGVPKELGEQLEISPAPEVEVEEVVEEPKRDTVEYDVWAKKAHEDSEGIYKDHRTPYLELFSAIGTFFQEVANAIENGDDEKEGNKYIEEATVEVLRGFNNVHHQTIYKRGDNGMEYNPIFAMFTALGKGEYPTAQMQFSQLAELAYNASITEVLADDYKAMGGIIEND